MRLKPKRERNKTRKPKYIEPGTDVSPAVGNSISCIRLLFITGSIID